MASRANAVALTLLGYVEYVLFLIVLAIPALAIAAVFPGAGPVLAILVFVGAWMLKLALADAFALAATLIAYHRTTAGMVPNPEWQAKLEGASEKFRELGRKAAETARAPGAAVADRCARRAINVRPKVLQRRYLLAHARDVRGVDAPSRRAASARGRARGRAAVGRSSGPEIGTGGRNRGPAATLLIRGGCASTRGVRAPAPRAA